MTIKYGTETIEVINYDKLHLTSPLTRRADKMLLINITIPKNDSNDILISEPYENINITFDSRNYEYKILSVDKQRDGIVLKCSSTLYEKINANLSSTYNEADINPISAVTALLNDYSIGYDGYSFAVAEDFFDDLGVTMDCVFIRERSNTMTILQFIGEILKRIACDIVIDMESQEVKLHNFIRQPIDYQDLFTDDYIDPNTIKYGESKDYFNSFSIGVYPASWANMVTEYTYDCTFDGNSETFHESYLTATSWVAGQPVRLRFDTEIGGVFFTGGTDGTFDNPINKTLYSTALEQKTIDLGLFSQESLYGTATNPKVREWKDERANQSQSVARHTNLEGAYKVGNKIVQSYYRKRQTIDFKYPNDTGLRTGDFVLWNDENYIVIDHYIDFNLQHYFKLEEVII